MDNSSITSKMLMLLMAVSSLWLVLGLPTSSQPPQQQLQPSSTTESPPTASCFFQPAENCPPTPGCKSVSEDALLCCHQTAFLIKEKITIWATNRTDLRKIHIRNSTLGNDGLNVSLLRLPNLEELSWTDGRVDRVVGAFENSQFPRLHCLNLSGNALSKVDNGLIANLSSLRILDLSYNNITNISLVPPVPPGNNYTFKIDLSNNSDIWCSNIKAVSEGMKNASWKLDLLSHDKTYCKLLRNYWFFFTTTVPFSHVEDFEKVEQECLSRIKCICEPIRLVYISGGPYMAIKVDCSNRNLTELPDIPEHTLILNVTNNSITSLKKITTDPNYRELQQFYADYNSIDSILDIEGSHFIKHMNILALRGNKLTEIPTYILSHAFERDAYKQVTLGENKVTCDCNTAQILKIWLLKNKKHVRDFEDIQCENFKERVIDLDQNRVCKYPRVWTDYINYIIAGEVTLLLFLISKVSYDYWIFRTAGYLPWPASKMPKMPCDFVFES